MMNKNIEDLDDEIDLKELFLILFDKKLLIVSISITFAFLSIFISLLLPNIYTSKTTLIQVDQEDSISSSLGSFSSLASISGISLPGESTSKGTEALERIKSLEFFSTYFLPNIKLENIMAVKKWNAEENVLVYDKSLFNQASDKWIRNVSFPRTKKPSAQESYEYYKKILSVSISKENQFVTLSIDHPSPVIAKKWVEIIIYNINESMREEDNKKAQNSIAFLNEAARSTSLNSMRDAIGSLLEGQMQILMLSSSSKAYIFKVLDSPVVPEKKSAPNRSFIVILGTLLGGLLSVLWVLVKYYPSKNIS